MKTFNALALAASMAAFLISCSKESTPVIVIDPSAEDITIEAPVEMTFTGITDNEPGTKTVLSGLNINWSPAEKIYLFDGTAPRSFSSTNDTEASTVSFSGSASSAASYYAVYPSGTISGKVISATIPVIQSATANSFAPKANIAVAYTESNPTGDNVLQFKNVGAVVKFQLANNDVRKVKLEAISGEKMSGPVDITFGEGASFTSAIVTAEAESCVVLDGGASNLSAYTPYYLAIYPNNYEGGFKITLIKADGSFRSFSNTNPQTLARNDLMDLTSLPSVSSWKIGGAVDELEYTLIGVSGTSYTDWDDKFDASAAVYKGNSAGGNNSIQLRSSSNSGIVSTTSGGKVTKVSVDWNSNTANGRTLDIYGKTTAYSAASDLYATSTQGTKLGSIINGTSTELSITGDYTYIGIRSNSGALYLDELNISWGDPSVTPPTLPTVDAPSTEIKNISSTTVPLAGGSITFDVDSNVPWTVATNQPLYSSVSVSGSTVTVTFSTLGSGSRSATVTVTPDEGDAIPKVFTQISTPDPVTVNTYSNQATVTGSGASQTATWTNGDITISAVKNNSSTPFRNSDTDHTRFYAKWTINVASTSYTIKKIDFTFATGDGSNEITANTGTYSNGTWTGSTSNVTFTIGGTSGNRRISSIVVTY